MVDSVIKHLRTIDVSCENWQLSAENLSSFRVRMTHCTCSAFRFAAADGGAVLKPVASAIFKELGLLEKMNIDKQTMDAFLTSIEAGYCEVRWQRPY